MRNPDSTKNMSTPRNAAAPSSRDADTAVEQEHACDGDRTQPVQGRLVTEASRGLARGDLARSAASTSGSGV